MLTNYLKLAWRNLKKDKGFSAINIFGLAVGLATCLLITLFVVDEFGYDRYNKKADRIFRIVQDVHFNGAGNQGIYTPAPMAAAMVRDFAAVENAARVLNAGDMLVKKGEETLSEPRSAYADSSFFDIFTVPFIIGDPHTALKENHSMVLSESMAKKYFNSTDVLGRTLLTNNTETYRITGVYKDFPAQSHFHFNFIKTTADLDMLKNDNWLSNDPVTYLLAKPHTTQTEIDKDLEAAVKKHLDPQIRQLLHSGLDDLAKNGDYLRYSTIPLTQIHLHSNVKGEFEPNGNMRYVYIFIIIAVFILLIACVNFMNLSTARSAGRSREVGVRKVLGSLRANLISQFLVESVMTSVIALILALGIATLLLPYFNQLSGKEISAFLFFSGWNIPILLAATLIVGLLAGSYPAFYLSAFQPIQVLKGKLSAGFKTGWFRNSLVVFQFATAIILIIGTLVIYSQLNYIRNKEVGYNRQQVITISNTYSLGSHAKAFKQDIQKLSGIVGGTMTPDLPNSIHNQTDGYLKEPTAKASQAFLLGHWVIDADYIPTLGIKMAAGRNFSPDMITDTSGVLLNETAAKLMGYTHPLNQLIYTFEGDSSKMVSYRILGVVKDFIAGTLRNKVTPMAFHLGDNHGAISFRIDTKNISGLIGQIKDRYHAVDQMRGQPFVYSFMDDDFNKLYQADERTGRIFISFAVFAILIACLGLFGLVTYAAEQRTKEIGIRKVLGASVGSVVGLLSKEFLGLVAVAALIAFPLAWWVMHNWLQDFDYRTKIGWWIFAVAGLSALAITLLTVSFRAVKTALRNPVNSLRTE
ncbi:MAG: ABC transporter permease [Puia sp.]|nr:ABC transporter permease [Puia sp.]